LCKAETQVARSLSNLSRLGLVLKSKNQHCNTLGHTSRKKQFFFIKKMIKYFLYFDFLKLTRMRNKKSLLIGFTAIVLLASCTNNGKTADASKTNDSTGTATSAPNESAPKSTINVTITGGDMNGTYNAVCKEGCCSWGIAGDKVFGNQYSETGKGAKELSSVQLIVDDVTGNKSTKEFTLTVGFGDLLGKDSKSFNIDTRKGNNKGSGTLDLQYSGDKATVTIKGTSAEGPAIDLKMECNKVMNPNNMGQ
jgi:hypothetical protein